MSALNQLKTAILLASLTSIFLLIGSFFGRSGLYLAFGLAVLMNVISYWYSDKIVLKVYRAKKANVADYKRLDQIVNDLAKKAKIPEPEIYIIKSHNPNAFATGRNPEHAAVAVTTAILDLLNENELKGVLAHELSHIKNRDILISTVAATIAGAISFIAFIARWGAIFGGVSRGRNGNIFELIALAIVAPLAATIIRLAISRSREYMADEAGAKLVRDGKGLASALKKLDEASKRAPMFGGSKTTSHMFIINPFKKSFFINLLSTHPSADNRIKKLEKLKF